MKFREILKEWMYFRKIGLRELAREIGVSAPTLSRFINGKDLHQESLMKVLNWLFNEPKES